MKKDTFKNFKEFFKNSPLHDDDTSCFGFCYTLGGERIGPCIWNRQYIANCCTNVEELHYRYYLIEDCDGKSIVLFLPLVEIHKLTEELYNVIICDFELEVKKVMERLKLEKINDDF